MRIWRLDQRQFREQFQGSIDGNLRSDGWLFEAIFGAVFMYIRGLFSRIIRVVSRLHASISNRYEHLGHQADRLLIGK